MSASNDGLPLVSNVFCELRLLHCAPMTTRLFRYPTEATVVTTSNREATQIISLTVDILGSSKGLSPWNRKRQLAKYRSWHHNDVMMTSLHLLMMKFPFIQLSWLIFWHLLITMLQCITSQWITWHHVTNILSSLPMVIFWLNAELAW